MTLQVFSATHIADSVSTLQSKINDAAPGDVITVKDGVYTTSRALTVSRRATAEQPIIISAETIGGVEVNGTHGFNVVQPTAHVIIRGFNFRHASGKNSIQAGTSHVRFTRNTFQCTGDGPYLQVSGDDAQVTPAEKHALYDAYVAYFGTYTLDREQGVVIHHVEADLADVFIGKDESRPFVLRDDTLILAPHWQVNGETWHGIRVFTRVSQDARP